jgi:hypothetical protein
MCLLDAEIVASVGTDEHILVSASFPPCKQHISWLQSALACEPLTDYVRGRIGEQLTDRVQPQPYEPLGVDWSCAFEHRGAERHCVVLQIDGSDSRS